MRTIIAKLSSIIANATAVLRVYMISFFMFAIVATLATASGHRPKVWMDEATGFAIGGYDPVAYFTKGKAVSPMEGEQASWGGVAWMFRNVGNKQVFLDSPHTYMPGFGGADPLMMANGKAVRGNPTLFDVYENRVYLFHSRLNLLRWRTQKAKTLALAMGSWPNIARELGLNSDSDKCECKAKN